MLSIEMQLLWGVFHEFVQEYPEMPTNGFERIQIHLMERLMRVHSYSLQDARDFVISVHNLYNENEGLFATTSELGSCQSRR